MTGHRILICGLGSVGKRHLENLAVLGYTQIAACRTPQNINDVNLGDKKDEVETFYRLDEALRRFSPTVAIICNPTSLHIATALDCARAGCHVFVEKPLDNALYGSINLARELELHDCFGMVGYMLRHHPHFKTVKRWLDNGENGLLGSPVWLRSSWGEFLPSWHPWEDYRESYAARPDLGGGPALTLSHDLDLAIWMLGRPSNVRAISNRATSLELECDHGIDILLSCDSGATANLHLDYFQSPPQRTWELVTTKGTANVDYFKGELTFRPNSSSNDESTVELLPTTWTRNDMFLDELKYFFSSIDSGDQPQPGIESGHDVVRIALLAQKNSGAIVA